MNLPSALVDAKLLDRIQSFSDNPERLAKAVAACNQADVHADGNTLPATIEHTDDRGGIPAKGEDGGLQPFSALGLTTGHGSADQRITTDSSTRFTGTAARRPEDAVRETEERRGAQMSPERESAPYHDRRTPPDPTPPPPASPSSWWTALWGPLRRHTAFIGPGIIASVGYTDPGNWVTDLAAGSQFGYKLLFTVLLSGLFGIFLQILAVRMGVVTGDDLARNTRMLLVPDNDTRLRFRSRFQSVDPIRFRNLRVVGLWILYLISEVALIATEFAELLGSAIALNLLFPGLPLYGGVLITCADVILFLFVYKPQGNFRIFEVMIAILVMVVLACYIALLVRTKPNWANVFDGYVPSSTLVQPEALYTSIGIVGAVIMPHAMYLGSHFSTVNRTDTSKNASCDDLYQEVHVQQARDDGDVVWHQRPLKAMRAMLFHQFPVLLQQDRRDINQARGRRPSMAPSPPLNGMAALATVPSLPPLSLRSSNTTTTTHTWRMRMTIAEMKMHLPHAAWDIALSLFFFAITINSAILIVAGAAFYYGQGSNQQLSDLYDAYNLLNNTLGKPYAVLFAIALLAAGQSASITCTLAGQIVSEGFINWRTNAFLRRTITRVITMVPSLAIAIGVGRKGLDQALIASQVILSFALPFVLVPLIMVTSMKRKMRVEDEVDQEATLATPEARLHETVDGHGQTALPMTSMPPPTSSLDAIHVLPVAPTVSRRMINKDEQRHADSPAETQPSYFAARSSPLANRIVHDFTNHWTAIVCASVICLIIIVADVYTLVTVFQGQ